MVFENRRDAGRHLAEALQGFAGRGDVIVLGVPRGGVVVASEITSTLRVPLDIFLSRKLSVPGQEELAFGAVAVGSSLYLNQQITAMARLTLPQIERAAAEATKTLARRAVLYRDNHPPLQIAGKVVILVDDGIATGASMVAAIQALHQMEPAKLILAVPVAPPSTCAWLRPLVDELVCLDEPEDFQAVGQFYRDFTQLTDDEVIDLLRKADSTPDNRNDADSQTEVNPVSRTSPRYPMA